MHGMFRFRNPAPRARGTGSETEVLDESCSQLLSMPVRS